MSIDFKDYMTDKYQERVSKSMEALDFLEGEYFANRRELNKELAEVILEAQKSGHKMTDIIGWTGKSRSNIYRIIHEAFGVRFPEYQRK